MNADQDGEVTLFTDGASRGNPGPAGIGLVLESGDGSVLAEISEPIGVATNNEAEYRAVIRGVARALELRVRRLHLITDSELVARQLTGVYRVRDARLQALHSVVQDLVKSFDSFRVDHTLRGGNTRADRLASQAAGVAAKANIAVDPSR